MKEIKFLNDNIKKSQIEEFLEAEFSRAGYSHCDIQRVPLAVRIIVYAQKPGMIIGRGGKTIDRITGILKNKFGLENPQMDVQEVESPDMDPGIVGKQIASAIERGINYKRVVNLSLRRVMSSGAVGVAIRVGGKVGGDKKRIEKFSSGYLKWAGDPAETVVRTAYTRAQVKLGTIGIQVRILVEMPKEMAAAKKIDMMIRESEAQGN